MLIFALAIQAGEEREREAGAKWQFIHFVVRFGSISLRFCAFLVSNLNLSCLILNLSYLLPYQQKCKETHTHSTTQRRQVTSATIVCGQKKRRKIAAKLQTDTVVKHTFIRPFIHSVSVSCIHPLIQLSTQVGRPFKLSFIQVLIAYKSCSLKCCSSARPSPPLPLSSSWHLFVN